MQSHNNYTLWLNSLYLQACWYDAFCHSTYMWCLLIWPVLQPCNSKRSMYYLTKAWQSLTILRSKVSADKMHHSRFVTGVTMALLECPPPWNSMVPKASVGLSCVCLLIDHFSDRLSFLAKRSALSFWLDEMPGGRPTCWPIRRPQQHLDERRK